MLYDANLKASYRTEDELLKKRETELLYFQNQIEKTELNLKRNKDKLHQFQQQAANIELSGRVVTGNLKKRLIATEQEIKNNHTQLERLSTENKASIEQYDQDLVRLRELLTKKGIQKAQTNQ
jgi:ubiquitin